MGGKSSRCGDTAPLAPRSDGTGFYRKYQQQKVWLRKRKCFVIIVIKIIPQLFNISFYNEAFRFYLLCVRTIGFGLTNNGNSDCQVYAS